jgi:CHAT domain-containing protein
MVGLTRAFMYAGASAVVVSLWSVRDSPTAELMKNLHKHLKLGQRPAEALRMAKLDLIGSDIPAYKHPYFWAPFVLVGNDK